MSIKEAVDVLKAHNMWRRDRNDLDLPMQSPTLIGQAIDEVVRHHNGYKLMITDKGDPSVGANEQYWLVDCPFGSDADDDEKHYFAQDMLSFYKPYCEGRIVF